MSNKEKYKTQDYLVIHFAGLPISFKKWFINNYNKNSSKFQNYLLKLFIKKAKRKKRH